MVEDKETKILHIMVSKIMYDNMIKQYGENGGFDLTKIKLKTYPFFKETNKTI